MAAACTECFISGQYSSLRCMLNLRLTFSKQFIVDTFTPVEKGPVLEDFGFESLLSKGSLTLV